MEKLYLRNVTLAYGERMVLNGITFGVKGGEFLGIVGPNGCGKSTTIKGITKVIPLKKGSVHLDNKTITAMSQDELARLIAVVPQHTSIPEAFTAFEVVLMGRTPHLGFLRYEGQSDINIATKAMEMTDTWHLAGRRVGELSGGEKQRLTIARALTQQPEVVLLDEPTSHLDINYQIETLELMSSLCQREGLAVLAALHDLNLAAQYCDRIIMLKEGVIYAEGNASDVITAANVREVYGADVHISSHPINHLPVTLITAGGS
ncbi:ABC transporter ATP-binding protein [Chloroflexota bacterium]